MLGESISNGLSCPSEEAENVDAAIADALQSVKNRSTVLRFEKDVIDFVQGSEEAYHFPLSLSGYQRLLAHRIAQYHGLQTATVDDGGDEHGNIKATKPQSNMEPRKPKLADVTFPEPSEDHKEQPRSLKKKSGERGHNGRDRDSSSSGEAVRNSSQRSRQQREMDYDAARRRHLGPIMDHQSPYGGQGGMPGPVPLGRGGHPGMDPNGKAVYRNRQEEMRDPDFHRPRSGQHLSGMHPAELDRYRAGLPGAYFSEPMGGQYPGMMGGSPQGYGQPGMDAQAAQMMGGLSLGHHPGEQRGYLAHPGMHPGMGVAGYPAMPYAYLPGAQATPQALPQSPMQSMNMGMYGSPGMQQYGFPMQMPYMAPRPGQPAMMMGQPMAAGMPYYPGYMPQGYNNYQMMPAQGNLGIPPQAHRVGPSGRFGNSMSSSPQHSASSSGPNSRRNLSVPPPEPQPRIPSSNSVTSLANSQSGTGEASTPATPAKPKPSS